MNKIDKLIKKIVEDNKGVLDINIKFDKTYLLIEMFDKCIGQSSIYYNFVDETVNSCFYNSIPIKLEDDIIRLRKLIKDEQ